MLEEFLLGEDGSKLVLRDAHNNIFSDIIESIIGAIFIDSGMDNIKSFIN